VKASSTHPTSANEEVVKASSSLFTLPDFRKEDGAAEAVAPKEEIEILSPTQTRDGDEPKVPGAF
jgi:hypothetical protein